MAVARARKRLSQIALADLARLSKNTIQRAEAGGSLSITSQVAIADALGADIDELFPVTK